MNETFDALQFFGRFHPLLVHLPIGLIILLVLLEAIERTRRGASAACNRGYILAVTAPSTALAALFGWFLSRSGEYDPGLVNWHLWTGLATLVLCLTSALFLWSGKQRAYLVSLILTFLLLVVASHFGGSLTHGREYLVEFAPAPVRKWLVKTPAAPPAASPAEWVSHPVFTLAVQPVLARYCVSCHGPEKSKGKLRLDTFEALMRGGNSGPSVVPGNVAGSLLVKRMKLSLDTDEHMPPEGKPQPKPDDFALIEWWIHHGANPEQLVGAALRDRRMAAILGARFSSTVALGEPTPLINSLPDVMPQAEAAAGPLGVVVSRLAESEPWLLLNASVAGSNFTDASLEPLLVVGANIRVLDLSGTAVGDRGLATVGQFTNLARLYLSRAHVTDAGLTHLAGLDELEYLNLYGTQISDQGLATLAELPKLNRLYLWETRVTPKAAEDWAIAKTDTADIAEMREQIRQLEQQIAARQVIVQFGAPDSTTNQTAEPINGICPVSGKNVDPNKILVYESRVIGFCCDDCRKQFRADPKPFLSKLAPVITNSTKTTPIEKR